MKLITKLSLVAATFAAIGTSVAFADDQQLQNRLARQRAADSTPRLQRHFNAKVQSFTYVPAKKTTTIAVYADRQGVNQRSAAQDEPAKTHFEWRWNANGQRFGLFVRDRK